MSVLYAVDFQSSLWILMLRFLESKGLVGFFRDVV